MEHIHKRLVELWEDEKFCDISLKTDEGSRQIHAHKIILASFSEYFAAMFNPDGKMAEGQMDCVTLKEMSFDALNQVITYAYTGEIDINLHNVRQLFKIADFLQVETLCKKCTCFMIHNINPQNCFKIFDFANIYNKSDLKRAAELFLQENFGEICQSGAAPASCLTLKTLCGLLSSDYLLLTNVAQHQQGEMVILNFVLNFLKRKDNLTPKDHAKLLSKVKLPWLPVAELDKLLKKKWVKQNSTCIRLVKHAKEQCLGQTRKPYVKSWDQPRRYADISFRTCRPYLRHYLRTEMTQAGERFVDFELAEACGTVTGLRIWTTKWQEETVIGGIQGFYGYSDKGRGEIHGSDAGEMSEFYLKPNERILMASIQSRWVVENYLIQTLMFETDSGTQFGPYGGDVDEDELHTENPATNGPAEGAYTLGYISGTVVDTPVSKAVIKLRFHWACDKNPDSSDSDCDMDSDGSSSVTSFSAEGEDDYERHIRMKDRDRERAWAKGKLACDLWLNI